MASRSDSSQWVIALPKTIAYGHPRRSFGQMCRKVVNTILSHWAYVCPSNKLRVMMHRWRGCHIGKGVYIGRYCMLDNMYPELIYIYDGVSINAQSMILTHFNPFEVWKGIFNAEAKPVVIKNDAIIAVRCTIMPGVTIGERAIVSSGCIIESDVPACHMVQTANKLKSIDLTALINK